MKKYLTLCLLSTLQFLTACIALREEPVAIETHVIPFPRLAWEPDARAFSDVGNPVEYQIQIARDRNFKHLVDHDKVALARYVPDRPLAPGDYFWRVRPLMPNSPAGNWSRVRGFVIQSPDEVIRVQYDPQSENHQPSIQAVMEQAMALNQRGLSVEVSFSPGIYRVRDANKFFTIKDVDGLIINGNGAVIHLLEYHMGVAFIENSRNVLVQGLTVDYPEQQTFLPGRVVAVDDASLSLTVELLKESDTYEMPYVQKGMAHFSLLHPTINGRLKAGANNHYFTDRNVQKVGERTFTFGVRNSVNGIEVGDRFIHYIRRGAGELFHAENSQNITYYENTNHAVGAGHYIGVSCSNIAILHCRSDILGDRWYGGNADGIHIRNNRIGPWVEGVTINAIGDDGVALYSRPVRAVETWPDGKLNALIASPEFFDFEPGDQVSFFSPGQGQIFFETRVVRTESIGANYQVVFEDAIPRKLSFSNSLQDDDQIWNRSTSNGDFVIRNSRFSNIRRFGAVFRAARGLIENCHFEGTSSAAILFLNETQYPNGLYCSEIVIRNNTIVDCSFELRPRAAIGFDFRRRASSQAAADYGPRYVLLENNQITQPPGLVLQLVSSRDFVIRNTTINGNPLDPMDPMQVVSENTKNIRWEQ
jgi:hypothetical protein